MWALPFYTVTPLSLAHLLNMLTLTTYSPAVQHGDTHPILALLSKTVTLSTLAQPPLAVSYGQLSTLAGCLSQPT